MSRRPQIDSRLGLLLLCLAIVAFFALIAGPSVDALILGAAFVVAVFVEASKGRSIFGESWDDRSIAEHGRLQEEQQRQRVESLLRRDAVADEINYMDGVEFERFMADVFRQEGYGVETTKASGDQGVDLLLDVEGKKVAVQLKRWTGPVGNKVVGATFAGMAHYGADEGWIITTSTFTKSARELARSTRVRLIDGRELGEWLEGLRKSE